MLHMILPRKDYEIVEDSWNVVGLRGKPASKDVIVKGRRFRPDLPDDGRGRRSWTATAPARGRE